MKLITMTNVSLDDVMQGLGDPAEDRRGGFTRGVAGVSRKHRRGRGGTPLRACCG
jgi:hypothetical protein